MASFNQVLTFGLISFPCRLTKATETSSTAEMKNLCIGSNGKPEHDPLPLVAPRCCTTCGEITDYSNVVKGIKQGTTYAITTQEAVAEAKVDNAAQYLNKVTITAHPRAEFEGHTASGKNIYYVTPHDAAANQYATIVAAIQAHPELAFASLYTPRSAAGLYWLVVRDGALAIEERTRGQAMKAAPVVSGTPNPADLQLLDLMLTSMTQPYDPDAYEDTYAAAIADLAAQAQSTVHLGKGATANEPAAAVMADSDLTAKLLELAKASAA